MGSVGLKPKRVSASNVDMLKIVIHQPVTEELTHGHGHSGRADTAWTGAVDWFHATHHERSLEGMQPLVIMALLTGQLPLISATPAQQQRSDSSGGTAQPH